MNDGWMERGWLIFGSFCPFQQYISHFRTYRELTWDLPIWNITRVAVAGPLKTSNS